MSTSAGAGRTRSVANKRRSSDDPTKNFEEFAIFSIIKIDHDHAVVRMLMRNI